MATNNLETRIAKLESATRRTGAPTEERSCAIWHALAAQEGGAAVVRKFARAAKAKDPQAALAELLMDGSMENCLLRAARAVRE